MTDSTYRNDMSADEKVMMAIVRIAEGFKKELSCVFKKQGLTFSQYNVLRILDACEDGHNTMRNINRIMLVSSANLTGIAKRLERSGFVIRKNDPNDDRVKRLEITQRGRKVLKDIADRKEAHVQKFLEPYSDAQKSALLGTLREILLMTRGKSR